MHPLPNATSQTWENPGSARSRQTGPLLREHPDVRALMVCASCGQTWLHDLVDSEDRDGRGEGRVIDAPVPEAAGQADCATWTTGDVDALRPRPVVHDDTASRIGRVA